jgi:hypothetical protein
MTTTAIHRGVGIFTILLIDMTGLTVQNGMNTKQGEIGLNVLFKHFPAIFPRLRRMAVLTAKAELALVNVCMTINTGCTDM